MRIPCSICGAMIMPATAQNNGGICGQCARDPARARAKASRTRIIEGYGTPTLEGITKRLAQLTEQAAKEAIDRFSGEQIYAFLLMADPHMECATPRVMTETWVARMPEGARWGGSGWYEEGYMLKEEEFHTISEWAGGLDIGPSQDRSNIMTGIYVAALRGLRSRRLFGDSTVLLLVSPGMGDSEAFAIAELCSSEPTLKLLAEQLSLDDEYLRAMRSHYSQFREHPAADSCP